MTEQAELFDIEPGYRTRETPTVPGLWRYYPDPDHHPWFMHSQAAAYAHVKFINGYGEAVINCVRCSLHEDTLPGLWEYCGEWKNGLDDD